MIQQRLSELSTDENEFNQVKGDYESALKNSGFGTQLKYSTAEKRPRNRKRNIIWFNPPFNSTLTTNLGKQFLALITKHFPQHHKFSKIFNRNTVKLSYSCSPNMKSVISGHNKSLLNSNKSPPAKPCNCRNKETCPLQGECQQKALIYKATVTTGSEKYEYIGCSESEFKTRFNNHQMNFRNRSYVDKTSLSQKVWELKDKEEDFTVSWSIKARSSSYMCGSRKCDLCLTEKFEILKSDPMSSLNKRSEMANKCRHMNKYKLKNAK